MSNCISPGWGSGAYGMTPWGGDLGATPGGPIPFVLPFDIYCVGPCGPMSVITTYSEVSEAGNGLQFAVDPSTLDQILRSGGVYPTDDVRLIITTSVPQAFTFDFTVRFDDLPIDFSDIVNKHIFLGVTDAAGPCAGLFFSKIGIAYVGGVHHDGSGNMVLDSVFQPLANSQLLVSEDEYWSVRIAASFLTGGVYIYVTKTSDLPVIGHQLRYVLPVIPAGALAFPPTDRTLISVRGTLGEPSQLAMDTTCLGSGFIVPNLPPIADAGLDQATRTCAIIQLDGTHSFDPEGASITYKWRLIDAPLGSTFMFDGVDGETIDTISGFTNKFHSASLGVYDGTKPIVAGDVLLVDGTPYTITGKAVDGDGFHVTVDGFVLSDDLFNEAFKLLVQAGISGSTTSKPTFLPDLAGFWKFDLIVFDGGLHSEASVVVVNVTESPIPRGCIPDLRFLWGYLSNFWNLVDDKDRITTYWEAVAQVAASELLTLWQIDYSKNLRDVQRFFQRRWLHYDPPLPETLPEVGDLHPVFQGCRTVELAVAGTAAYAATVLTVASPVFTTPISFTFPGGVQTPAALQAALKAKLQNTDSRFDVHLIDKSPLTHKVLRIYAPFPFTITHVSGTAFMVDFVNAIPNGTGGVAVGVRTYKVDRSLSSLGIAEGDVLTLDGVGYRILRTTTDPSDAWPDQRLTLEDDLPIPPPGTWQIAGIYTSKALDFYNGLVTADDKALFVVVDNEIGSETFFEIDVHGATEGLPAALSIDTLPFSHFLLDTEQYSVQLIEVRRYKYIPIDSLVSDIPYLQEKIRSRDDKTVLRRNLDFFLETFRGSNAIRFVPEVWDTPPPNTIWAETTYLDNRPVVEQNFGIPVEFTLDNLSQLPSNVDYLSAVRGLWYSYFNGPTLFNLRAGVQILLGLPFAEEAGVIEEIRTDFSPTLGRILIRDSASTEIVRSYTFPASLELETNPVTKQPYAEGDVVQQFAPLVTGSEVVDWVKDPKWFEGYLNQGIFYEVEKFHRFLVRVDSAAFSLPALLFVQTFVRRIKPTYTYPLFVVQQKIGDTEVSTTDDIDLTGKLLLFDGACFPNYFGIATMFDEPDPSGGGWQSQFDTDSDPVTLAPSFPNPQAVSWAYDKNLMCPEDYILATACITLVAPAFPEMDSIFAWDTEVYSSTFALFQDSWITFVPTAGVTLFQNPTTITANGTITDLELNITGDPGASDPDYQIIIKKNGVDQAPIAFTQTAGNSFQFHTTLSLAVVISDTLSVRIEPVSPVSNRAPFWKSVSIELGISVLWAYDVQLGAGTYCVYKSL